MEGRQSEEPFVDPSYPFILHTVSSQTLANWIADTHAKLEEESASPNSSPRRASTSPNENRNMPRAARSRKDTKKTKKPGSTDKGDDAMDLGLDYEEEESPEDKTVTGDHLKTDIKQSIEEAQGGEDTKKRSTAGSPDGSGSRKKRNTQKASDDGGQGIIEKRRRIFGAPSPNSTYNHRRDYPTCGQNETIDPICPALEVPVYISPQGVLFDKDNESTWPPKYCLLEDRELGMILHSDLPGKEKYWNYDIDTQGCIINTRNNCGHPYIIEAKKPFKMADRRYPAGEYYACAQSAFRLWGDEGCVKYGDPKTGENFGARGTYIRHRNYLHKKTGLRSIKVSVSEYSVEHGFMKGTPVPKGLSMPPSTPPASAAKGILGRSGNRSTNITTPSGSQRSPSKASNITRSTDASIASKIRKMTAADLERESSEDSELEIKRSKSGDKIPIEAHDVMSKMLARDSKEGEEQGFRFATIQGICNRIMSKPKKAEAYAEMINEIAKEGELRGKEFGRRSQNHLKADLTQHYTSDVAAEILQEAEKKWTARPTEFYKKVDLDISFEEQFIEHDGGAPTNLGGS